MADKSKQHIFHKAKMGQQLANSQESYQDKSREITLPQLEYLFGTDALAEGHVLNLYTMRMQVKANNVIMKC